MDKKKDVVVYVLSLIVILLLFSCATDRLGVNIVKYVNQSIHEISELEKISLKEYASVTGKNYTTDKAVYDALKNKVIPTYKQFLDLLRKINPEMEEVKNLHGVYVHGAEMIYTGFKTKLVGLEEKDINVIQAANNQIQQGRIETERWRDELFKLYKKHGVAEIKKKNVKENHKSLTGSGVR